MKNVTGVYETQKKDGTTYYRSSITYKNKHISLGSFSTFHEAHQAYLEADKLLCDATNTIEHYKINKLSFEKAISLLNYRDHGLYAATPIYVQKHFFRYYLAPHEFLTFDIDDLFYYSSRKIMRRGNHLFVADYGMQVSILSRYGIKSHAVLNRDYRFKNGDTTDFRYANLEVINPYYGVSAVFSAAKTVYRTKIHVNGDFIVGTYATEEEAAIAYNKAVDILRAKGVNKNFSVNYIEGLPASRYADLYAACPISSKIISYCSQ